MFSHVAICVAIDISSWKISSFAERVLDMRWKISDQVSMFIVILCVGGEAVIWVARFRIEVGDSRSLVYFPNVCECILELVDVLRVGIMVACWRSISLLQGINVLCVLFWMLLK